MHEPEFFNNTSFTAVALPLLDTEGAECRVVVVKATYHLGIGEVPADEPRPLRFGDEMWKSSEVADVKYPSDLCTFKPGTDFLIVGHVVGDELRRPSSVDVQIRVANRIRTLRVHGERFWEYSPDGVEPGAAAPVARVPLAWSQAWGGFDDSDSQRPLEEPRNPVGSGVSLRPKNLVGKRAPQIEDPQYPVAKAGTRGVPAGCAALGRHFEPRRKWAGTFDAAWLESRHPARPADYDPRHENCAPPEFVFQESLAGGTEGHITGIHPDRDFLFTIPGPKVVIEATIDGALLERRPHLDTVLADTDAGLIELVWRTAFRCPPKMRKRFARIEVNRKDPL